MSHIDVYLTSSKWAESVEFAKLDVPVCKVNMAMLIFGSSPHENEVDNHRFSQVCKDTAKFVIVNDIRKSIYIGDDKNATEGTGLVEYQCEKENEFNVHFFKRWNEIKTLLFEFSVYGNDKQISFCLRGLWLENHWDKLDILGISKVEVVPPKK